MEQHIAHLPSIPGVYLFLDPTGEILYIGKAKNLRRRVASYFQVRDQDPKIDQLLKEHAEIRFIATKNEIAALLLEAHLIQRYQPPFNVLLREGNPFIYLVFTESSGNGLSHLEIERQKPLSGRFFGPFINKKEVRAIHDFLIRTFRLKTCTKKMEHGCLDYHIGRCAGTCRPDFDKAGYMDRLELAHDLLIGKRTPFIKKIDGLIDHYNKELAFEKSQELNEIKGLLEHLFDVLETKFSEKKYVREIANIITPRGDNQEDREQGLVELQAILKLKTKPRTIDCFDISHFQGHHLVGSCIRFTDGMPDADKFRRFNIKSLSQQNDYAALYEIVSRRYKNGEFPDVIVIDGGKGQRNTVLPLVGNTPCIALAKREETIFGDAFPEGIILDRHNAMGRLLIALRNYAHHFAISFYKSKSLRDMSE